MTAFAIHGWAVDVADKSWEYTPELVGDVIRRGATANARATRRARKGSWSGATTILDPSDANPLFELLTSGHDVWSFDADVLSSKGYGWSATPTLDATNKKFGASSMSAASGTSYQSLWAETTVRTVLYWRRPNSGSFNHYALSLSGSSIVAKWKNGVTTAETVTNWFTANADGSFILKGKDDAGANSVAQYDDVVVLPFAVTQAQVTAWAAATAAWADAPALNVSGTLFAPQGGSGASPSVVVIPKLGKAKFVQGVSPLDGVYKEDLQAMDFTLTQV